MMFNKIRKWVEVTQYSVLTEYLRMQKEGEKEVIFIYIIILYIINIEISLQRCGRELTH